MSDRPNLPAIFDLRDFLSADELLRNWTRCEDRQTKPIAESGKWRGGNFVESDIQVDIQRIAKVYLKREWLADEFKAELSPGPSDKNLRYIVREVCTSGVVKCQGINTSTSSASFIHFLRATELSEDALFTSHHGRIRR